MSEITIICPECMTEYRDGFTMCSDCNVALVRRLDSDAGEQLVPLAHEHSFQFVAELVDRLERNDVPYVIQAGTALQLFDSHGAGPARPKPWEARIWVASSSERRAAEILGLLTEELRSQNAGGHGPRYSRDYSVGD